MRLSFKRWIKSRSPRALIGIIAASVMLLAGAGSVVALTLGGNPSLPPATTTVTFTSSGTWVVPGGVASVVIEAWGGGAGGGPSTSGEGGGGGGAYAKSTVATSGISSMDVTIGAGGGIGTAGGLTSVNDSGGALTLLASAAGGSASSDGRLGGIGGTTASSFGDVLFAGGTGGPGSTNASGGGGGGGSSAGSSSNGNTGGTGNNLGNGGLGGTAPTGGYAGGAGGFWPQAGTAPANANGGGGGGGGSAGNTSAAGAAGLVTITYANPTAVNLQRGLIGHWKMDGNAKDSTPYGNDGTVTAASLTTDRKGATDKAYNFNSSSDLISVPFTATHWPTAGISVSLWVKPSNMAKTTVQSLVGNLQNGGYALLVNADGAGNCPAGLKWVMYIGGGQRSNCIPKTILTDDLWSHIVGTFDGTDIKLYVDGVLQDTDTFAGAIEYSSTTTPLCIGLVPGSSSCSGGNFPGVMDDVRLYNRALSQAEINTLYESYDAGIKLGGGVSKLLGQWKLDGNTKDSSPFGNNMSLAGTTVPTLTTDRLGIANSAYNFDGTISTGGYLVGSTSNVYDTDVNVSRSYSIWFYASGLPAHKGLMLYKSANCIGWFIQMNANGSLSFDVTTSSNGCVSDVTYTISPPGAPSYADSTWHLATFVVDRPGATATAYIDGVVYGSVAINNTVTGLNAGTLRIGTDFNDGLPYTGKLDDARIYSGTIAATDIQAQYAAYKSEIAISDLQKGLVGWWPFNGNAKDATPYADNGTVASATLAADRSGIANSAYAFDGSTSKITVADAAQLDLPANFSVSIWIKPGLSSIPTNTRVIGKSDNTIQNYLLSYNAGNKMRFVTYIGSTQTLTGLIDINDTSHWYHIVGVRNGTTLSLYVDGQLDNSMAVGSGAADTNSFSVDIGYRGSEGATLFTGNMDDARIYNRALSVDEIQALYQSH